ncbi:unnamed protein product, partial [Ectocarpus fasciculatus]
CALLSRPLSLSLPPPIKADQQTSLSHECGTCWKGCGWAGCPSIRAFHTKPGRAPTGGGEQDHSFEKGQGGRRQSQEASRRRRRRRADSPPPAAGVAVDGDPSPPAQEAHPASAVGAAAASYYVTIHKMKDQDFLGDAEKEAEEEAQVNLHKSGLKISSKVVPEKVEKVINRAADVVAKAAGKVEDKVEEVSGDVKDAASEVSSKASDAAKEIKGEAKSAAAAVEAALTGEEVPKKKGWRKYIIFGPRREG